AAAFDVLGRVVGTAFTGKRLPAPVEGDSLDGFPADLTQAQIDGFLDATDPRAAAAALLGNATSRVVYDDERFRRTRLDHPSEPSQWQPGCTIVLTRETHVSDPLPAHGLRIQIVASYSDGFNRDIQKKTLAEAGPLSPGEPPTNPRWVGSGWTI